jgi:hypothetical protein
MQMPRATAGLNAPPETSPTANAPVITVMPMAKQMKSALGFSAPGQNRNAIAIGTNKRSPVSVGFTFTMNSGRIAHAPAPGLVSDKLF